MTYALPAQAWVGPHQCAVITGLARAGINALVELAGEKTPRGRALLGLDPGLRLALADEQAGGSAAGQARD